MLSTDPLLVKSQFQLVKVPPFALDKSVKDVVVPKHTFGKVKLAEGLSETTTSKVVSCTQPKVSTTLKLTGNVPAPAKIKVGF